jgi:pimeloyl-ACP methyl ester carboxylesterase
MSNSRRQRVMAGMAIVVAAGTAETGRAAADPPGAAACAAIAAANVAPATTLTATYDAGSVAQPAHCVVRGIAAPRTGVDGKPYETRFELRLPTAWSGRFLYQGGGGNDGIVAPAVGRNTGAFPETGLQRGFAVVTTDAGHQSPTPEFGLDPVARTDHAYAAHERTYTIAQAIVSRYYGRAADRRYFVGCSGGGRQGMMFAQRYPSYFDGIAICAPAMRVSSGATIAAAWDTQTFLSVAPDNAEGQRVLSRAFSEADMTLVARGITAACDAADGATDGMVLTSFDFDRDPARMQPFSMVFDTYRDATLAEFRKRGGKLLIFHGTADPIFSALESIDYYQRLTSNNGGAEATSQWARLFLVPGMNHCAGGPATDSFDGLGAITDWVEKQTAPARIEASALPTSTFFPGRTRPLCPYPASARYTGTGSLEDGASFACAAK